MGFFNRKRDEERRAQSRQHEHELGMVQRGFRQNKKMSLLEYNRNRESWRQQNEYNNPAAQMQRFKDAGLNPNLIYGQGSPGNATEMPKYSAPSVDYSGVANPLMGADQLHMRTMDQRRLAMDSIGQYMDVKQKAANIDFMNSRKTGIVQSIEQSKASTDYTQSKTEQNKNLYGQDGKPLQGFNQDIVDLNHEQQGSLQAQKLMNEAKARLDAKKMSLADYETIIRAVGAGGSLLGALPKTLDGLMKIIKNK